MPSSSSKFPNRDFNLQLDTAYSGGLIYWTLYAVRIGSYSQSYSTNGTSSWNVVIGGASRGSAGSLNFDFRGSAGSFVLGSGSFGAGPGSYAAEAYASYSVLGYTQNSHWISVAGPPAAPSPVGVDQATVNTLRYQFSGNSDGGSPITGWTAQIATDAAFTQNVQTVGSSGTTVFGGLTPGTLYYFRSSGTNAVGTSPWSSVITGSTLPATPPGITVNPTIPGTGASVVLTPPGGSSGVTKYTVERRVFGTTTPVTSTDTLTSPLAVAALTPGTSYEWRASAWFGTYQTPWSSWIAVVQPSPNTDPGSYFDGNTTDTPALDYGWTGTANNSTSTATGLHPTGWRTFAQSNGVSGGTGAVFRAAGGYAGSFAARAVFFTDASAAGFEFGMADTSDSVRADIEGGAVYFGNIYAMPSRAQRLRAAIRWYNAAGAYISTTAGVASLVNPGSYTRLQVSGTAPALAQWASIVVQDQSGTGWSTWKGGDWLQLDAAMITLQQLYDYFDGSTPDSALFRYDWVAAANASASTRTTLTSSTIDPLADPDCDPIPLPPATPKITDDCIIDVGTWRRYWAIIPESEVSDYLTMLPTIYVTTGGFDARQVRIRVYENPQGLSPETFVPDTWMSEQIVSYMPPLTTMTLDSIDERVFAEINGAAPIPADKLLYGTGGIPATWPTLSCGMGYLLSFDVPLDAPLGNVSIAIDLTRRV